VTYNANTLRENNQDTRNNFFSLNLRSSIDYFIKKVIQLHSDAEFTRQGKNQIFPSNFDRFLWNVWISKKLLKSNQLTIKIAVNDLLNSNSGFSRSASFSTFSENRYLTLRRYVMLSASWNFTKYKQLTK
jgi:alpha-L-arabinofuranosidase